MIQLPAYLQNLPSRNLAQAAIANVGAGNPPHLSIEGSRFTLVDVAGNIIPIQTLHVDVVIVDVNGHISKIYYNPATPYDPKNPSASPPLCFSDNGQAPSMNAGHPQAPTCASCPNNVWGSKISLMGSAVKACRDEQKIAVYVGAFNEQDKRWVPYSDGIFLLRIPPGSFINWRAYMAKFAGAGLDPDRVITRISFPETNTLGFQSPGYITEPMVVTLAKMIESKAADMMIGRMDRPRTAAIAGPTPQAPAAVAPPAAPFTSTPEPASAAPQAPFAQPAASPAMPAASATASPSDSPQRRRRRTQAEMQAAQQPAPPAQGGQQAPFRPDAPPQAAQPQQQAPQGQFGMVANPPPPPPGLDLDAVFK